MTRRPVYWLSPVGEVDHLDYPYNGVMYDVPLVNGMWANVSYETWQLHGRFKKLGTGLGQKFELQEDGRWLKVEG